MARDNIYFAADTSEKKVVYLEDRAAKWYGRMNNNGYMTRMITSWQFYYGFFENGGHDITFSGESGELLNLPVNNYANLARHIINFITGAKVAFMCKSVNTDRKSMVQATLGNNILNYYAREQNLQDVWDKALEFAVVMGQGFVLTEWDTTKGEKVEIPVPEESIFSYDEYDRPLDAEGKVIFPTYEYTGDISSRALSPLDVVYDYTKTDMRQNDWFIVRTFKNKYDLAAKFPDLADEILSISNADSKRFSTAPVDNEVDIPVYQFFHRPTEALPNGNYVYYINKDIILVDTDMPYSDLPVKRITYSEVIGTSFAHTALFDLIPLQRAMNSTFSTILTNHNAFGVQNILNPAGNGVSFDQVTDGMNWIEYDPEVGPPQSLNSVKISPDSYRLIEIYNNYMELLSGVNSVSRGVPSPQLTSGTALALVQSQALQFMNKPQQSYIRLLEDCGTFIINLLKDFADEPRVIAIAGLKNKTRMMEFKNDDISNINRVVVDVGNSLMQCLEKGTEVLMFDGSLKKVEDIVVGDLVMGPDSKKRTVNACGTGTEQMYEVHEKRKNGKKVYGCNESHIMTLEYVTDCRKGSYKKGDIIDISVRDYLNLPKREQRVLYGFRTEIEYTKKDLKIDPYILGSWLGDGTKNNVTITSMDNEILEYWENYGKSFELEVVRKEKKGTRAITMKLVAFQKGGNKDRNPLYNIFREYNLIGNKHIPSNYLISSIEDRLQLLAGFIDTDGTLNGQTFTISQKNDELSQQIYKLAKSLGFFVSISRKVRKNFFNPEQLTHINTIIIGGDTYKIPTKLPRKQAKNIGRIRSHKNYGLNIIKKEVDTYYGFTLEEEPHFVLGDYTVTHNTAAGRWQIAEQMIQMGLITTPEKVIELLQTGSLDTLIEGTSDELDTIRAENEALVNGNPIIAIAIDEHVMHIREHRAVIADPVLRLQDPELVQRTINHIMEHINLLRNTDPALLSIIGEQPLGPAQGTPPNTPQPEIKGSPEAAQVIGNAQNLNQGPAIPQPATPPGEFANAPQNAEQLMMNNIGQ